MCRFIYVFILISLILVNALTTYGQTTSAIGRFAVNYAKGCPPFTLEITEVIPFEETFYQYEDLIVNESKYTFDSVGTYTIFQFIQEDNNPNGKIDSIQITLQEALPPDFIIYTCPGNKVAVEITEDYYDFYRVYFSASDSIDVTAMGTTPFVQNTPGNDQITVRGFFEGGSPSCASTTRSFIPEADIPAAQFTRLAVLQDTIAVINYDIPPGFDYFLEKNMDTGDFEVVATLDREDGFYDFYKSDLNAQDCFRLTTTDACDGSIISSDTLCVVDLAIENTPEGNLISFEHISGGRISLAKDDIPVYEGEEGFYEDADLTCNVENCYEAGLGRSFSETICVTPNDINLTDGPENLQSSFIGSDVRLTWELEANTAVQSYDLYRNSRASTIFGENLSHTISGTGALQPVEYALAYSDECGNTSTLSNNTTPIILEADKLDDGLFLLRWNRYEGWPEGVKHYFLEIADENGNWNEETLIFSGRSIEIRPGRSLISYRIRAISALDTPRETFSNPITLEGQPTLLLPNAFSPNEDGLNESFLAVGSDVFNFQMVIFNQWGEILFETRDIDNGWTGYYKGALMPAGYYMYKVQFEDDKGKIFEQRGNFVLIR